MKRLRVSDSANTRSTSSSELCKRDRNSKNINNNDNNNNNNDNNNDNNDNDYNKNNDNDDNDISFNNDNEYHDGDGRNEKSDEIRYYKTDLFEKKIKEEIIQNQPGCNNKNKIVETTGKTRNNRRVENRDENDIENGGNSVDWCPSVSICSNIPRGTKIRKWFNVHPEAAVSGGSPKSTKKRWFVGTSYIGSDYY